MLPTTVNKATGTVTVLLFAQAKERVGKGSIQIELLLPTKTSELKEKLIQSYPEIASLVAISRLAVNRSFASEETVLAGSEEIAIIPPVSGG